MIHLALVRIYLQVFALAAGFLNLLQESSFEIVMGLAAAIAKVTLDEVSVQQRVVVVVLDGVVEGSVGGFELLFGLVGHNGLNGVMVSFP